MLMRLCKEIYRSKDKKRILWIKVKMKEIKKILNYVGNLRIRNFKIRIKKMVEFDHFKFLNWVKKKCISIREMVGTLMNLKTIQSLRLKESY